MFDLFHFYHLYSFYEAKKYGDILVVGLNSDESVKNIKGKSRPIRTEFERASILVGISYIDYVVIFNENTPIKFLNSIKPNVHCKGGDYKNKEDLLEYKLIKDLGGDLKILTLIKGKSTTNEINLLSNF